MRVMHAGALSNWRLAFPAPHLQCGTMRCEPCTSMRSAPPAPVQAGRWITSKVASNLVGAISPLCTQVLATFANGRIEEFLQMRSLQVGDPSRHAATCPACAASQARWLDLRGTPCAASSLC